MLLRLNSYDSRHYPHSDRSGWLHHLRRSLSVTTSNPSSLTIQPPLQTAPPSLSSFPTLHPPPLLHLALSPRSPIQLPAFDWLSTLTPFNRFVALDSSSSFQTTRASKRSRLSVDTLGSGIASDVFISLSRSNRTLMLPIEVDPHCQSSSHLAHTPTISTMPSIRQQQQQQQHQQHQQQQRPSLLDSPHLQDDPVALGSKPIVSTLEPAYSTTMYNELSPTPGPSSLNPRSTIQMSTSRRPSIRSLSLKIPQDGHAFSNLQTQPMSAYPAHALDVPRPSLPSNLGSSRNHSNGDQIPSTSTPSAASPMVRISSLPNQPPALLPVPSNPKLAKKRPSRLNLAPPSTFHDAGLSSRSMPNSPAILSRHGSREHQAHHPVDERPSGVKDLASALRGTPRRRPSMPFAKSNVSDYETNIRPPEAFRDPSEHILSGKGSTLQHARSVYSQGPVEILPSLFLGDEHNACDNQMLSQLGITTILNVAKETTLPFQLDNPASPPPSSCSVSSSSLRLDRSEKWPKVVARAMASSSSSSSAAARILESPTTGPVRQVSEPFYTPLTSVSPFAAQLQNPPRDNDMSPSDVSQTDPRLSSVSSPSLLRSTSSTPNLLTKYKQIDSKPSDAANLHWTDDATDNRQSSSSTLHSLTAQDVLRYRTLRRNSSTSSDDAFDTASSPSSRAPSTCTSLATELTPPALMSAKSKNDSGRRTGSDSSYLTLGSSHLDRSPVANHNHEQKTVVHSLEVTQVKLPTNATVLKVCASPVSARIRDIRYIKLPWTHDETDLASAKGGFTQGCAIIAEALGFTSKVWEATNIADDTDTHTLLSDVDNLDKIQPRGRGGKVLVHCQCGVSRSATMVIAFVMQAAAMRYGFQQSRSLMGMHDCYNMVKDKSSSISPNISLIYQLVEWERHLSRAASRLRDALGCNTSAPSPGSSANMETAVEGGGNGRAVGPGWSTEPMDEAMWSKMRLEEEEKEAAEEERRRQQRLEEAKRLATERRAAQEQLEARAGAGFASLHSNQGSEGSGSGGQDSSVGSLMQRRRKKAAVPSLQLYSVATAAAVEKPLPSAKRRPPMLNLQTITKVASDANDQAPDTPFLTARMNMAGSRWPKSQEKERRTDPTPTFLTSRLLVADVEMADVGSEVASTLELTDGSLSTPTIATPSLVEHREAPSPASACSQRMPASSPALSPSSSKSGTTPLSFVSAPMATSFSVASGMARFSFGGSRTGGSTSALLSRDKKSRPGSLASIPMNSATTPSSGSGSGNGGLFGATAQTREERRKQHRRTFSSDWPALNISLELERKSSSQQQTLSVDEKMEPRSGM